MTRIGKKEERRGRSPRRPKLAGKKTGPKPEKEGYRKHENAAPEAINQQMFIAKVS